MIYVLFIFLAPWNSYFGGHFHYIPGWAGHGWIQSAAVGGAYYLWLNFEPTTPGYRKSPLKGTAYLCSPRGEKFRSISAVECPVSDLSGVPIHLYLYNWPLLASFMADRRPSFDLYGTFGNLQMTLDDHGSLARAFRRDGTLTGPKDRDRPWNQPSSQVTLQEDWSWRFQGCPGPR